jgi:protein tyrosine/serine phosphatase
MILLGAALGGFIALGWETLYVTIGSNLHTVLPGQCYRSAQLSGAGLESAVHRLHIRTVINLRGRNDDEDWYHDECAAVRRLGISHVDIKLSGYEPTVDEELRGLVEALDHSAYPILLHCASGADRSGLASAMFLLLKTDTDLPTARRQISIRYGHNCFGAANYPTRLLNGYEAWLTQEGKSHSADNLRHWVLHVYHYADHW